MHLSDLHVDPRISLGSVLAIVTILITVGLSWTSLAQQGVRVEEREMALERKLDLYAQDHDVLVDLRGRVHAIEERETAAPARSPRTKVEP